MLAEEGGQTHRKGFHLVRLEENEREEEVVPDRHGVVDGHQRDGRGDHWHDHEAVDGKVVAAVDLGCILKLQGYALHKAGQDENCGGQGHRKEDEYDRQGIVDKPQSLDKQKQRDDCCLQRQHDAAEKEHVHQGVEPVCIPADTIRSHGAEEQDKGHGDGRYQEAVGEVPGKTLVDPYGLIRCKGEGLRQGERGGQDGPIGFERGEDHVDQRIDDQEDVEGHACKADGDEYSLCKGGALVAQVGDHSCTSRFLVTKMESNEVKKVST